MATAIAHASTAWPMHQPAPEPPLSSPVPIGLPFINCPAWPSFGSFGQPSAPHLSQLGTSSVTLGFLRPHSSVPRRHPSLSSLSPWPQLDHCSATAHLIVTSLGSLSQSPVSSGLSPATLGSFLTLMAPIWPLPVHGPFGMHL